MGKIWHESKHFILHTKLLNLMNQFYTSLQFNCLSPGPFETEGAFSRLDPTGSFRSQLKDQIPVGRMGDVEEVANLACYMISDYANWLNGAVIQFDGGKLPFMAGDFNGLVNVDNEQWDQMEQIIRSGNAKSKL